MRKLIFTGAGFAACTLIFIYGILVGNKHYPPYYLIVTVREHLIEGNHDNDGFERSIDTSELIGIANATDVINVRSDLLHVLWADDGLPLALLPSVEPSFADDRYDDIAQLERIDRLTVEMDFNLRSICYHFVPKVKNGKLLIYHQGHLGDFHRGKPIIQELLRRGYSVIGMTMPLCGMNNQPAVKIEKFGWLKIRTHEHMKFLLSDGKHPLRFFIEPVVAITNYVEKQGYERVGVFGISGGGWTTLLSAAVDPRLKYTYPVAGSTPMYLRSQQSDEWGDYEQTVPEIYRVANYLELYVLASTGTDGEPRRHIQFLNKYDPCCFYGDGYKSYEKQVKEAVRKCGSGKFDIIVDDTHAKHQISSWAFDKLLTDFEAQPAFP